MDATIRIEAGQVRLLLGKREAKLSIPYDGSTPLGYFREVDAAVEDPRFLRGSPKGQLTISKGYLELTADGRTTKQLLPTHGRMTIADFPILVDAIIRARNVVGLRRKALVDVVAIGELSNLERQAISEALTKAGFDGSLVRMPIPVESHSYVPPTLSKMLFWIFIVIVMLLAVKTSRSIWIVAPIWLVAFVCLEAYSHFQDQRSRHDRLQSAWNNA